MAPRLAGRQSMAAGFLSRMSIAPRAMKDGGDKDNQIVPLTLLETLQSAVGGTRDNTDVTDQLWSLLVGKTPHVLFCFQFSVSIVEFVLSLFVSFLLLSRVQNIQRVGASLGCTFCGAE